MSPEPKSVARVHPDLIGDIFLATLKLDLIDTEDEYQSFASLIEASLYRGRMSFISGKTRADMTLASFDAMVFACAARCKAGKALWNNKAFQHQLATSDTGVRCLAIAEFYIGVALNPLSEAEGKPPRFSQP